MLGRYLFLLSCQTLVSYMLVYEAWRGYGDVSFNCYPRNLTIVLTRFICGTILHFSLHPEIT